MNTKFSLFSFFIFYPFVLSAIINFPRRLRARTRPAITFAPQMDDVMGSRPSEPSRGMVPRPQSVQEIQLRTVTISQERASDSIINGMDTVPNNLLSSGCFQENLLFLATQIPFLQHPIAKWGMTALYTHKTILKTNEYCKHHPLDGLLMHYIIIRSLPLIALHLGNEELYGRKIINTASLTWATYHIFNTMGKLINEVEKQIFEPSQSVFVNPEN